MSKEKLHLLKESLEKVKTFDTSTETFAALVREAFAVLPLTNDKMARHFGCTLTTIERWKEGTASPHQSIRRVVYQQLLRFISDQE